MMYSFSDYLLGMELATLDKFKVKEMANLYNKYKYFVNSDFNEFFESLGKCDKEIMTWEQLDELRDELAIGDDLEEIIGNIVTTHIYVGLDISLDCGFYENKDSYFLTMPKKYAWDLTRAERVLTQEEILQTINNGIKDIAEEFGYFEEEYFES